jgi:hypothetical protein
LVNILKALDVDAAVCCTVDAATYAWEFAPSPIQHWFCMDWEVGGAGCAEMGIIGVVLGGADNGRRLCPVGTVAAGTLHCSLLGDHPSFKD